MDKTRISIHAPLLLSIIAVHIVLPGTASGLPVQESPWANKKAAVPDWERTLDAPETPGVNGTIVQPKSTVLLNSLNQAGWEGTPAVTCQLEQGRLRLAANAGLNETKQESKFVSLPPYIGPGELPILQEFGCRFLSVRKFQHGNRYIYVQASEFGRPDGANAGYDLIRKGSTTVLKRGDGSSEDNDSISFWQDRYVFIISGTAEDDDESKDVVTSLADSLQRAIIEHAPPPAVLAYLPLMDRVCASEKIVMGPLSAGRYFPVANLSALSIASARAAAVADYQVFEPARERMKLLFIDYGNPDNAWRAYSSFVAKFEELRSSKESAVRLGSAPPLEPRSGSRQLFRLNKSYLLCELKGSKLVLVSGARKSKSSQLLAGQIADR